MLSRRIDRLRYRHSLASEEQVISSGEIELSSGPQVRVVVVDTESAAATDDLDTIDGTRVDDLLILMSADSARDVRLTTAGNLKLGAFGSFTLLTVNDRALFHSDGTDLNAISLRNN
jgi:hypothetical protein